MIIYFKMFLFKIILYENSYWDRLTVRKQCSKSKYPTDRTRYPNLKIM